MSGAGGRFRVEVLRGGRWAERASGELSETLTRERLAAELPRYALQYRHRLVVDDEVVAEAEAETPPG